jgi:hypothetical protein
VARGSSRPRNGGNRPDRPRNGKGAVPTGQPPNKRPKRMGGRLWAIVKASVDGGLPPNNQRRRRALSIPASCRSRLGVGGGCALARTKRDIRGVAKDAVSPLMWINADGQKAGHFF